MSLRRPGWMDELEWTDQRNRGLVWCFRDQTWEAASRFDPHPSRVGEFQSSCRRSLASVHSVSGGV
jgi:hypothetical protein